ncbi:MAG: tRNA 2-methylthio-N6-isopentenyl adenosine(37) hydroxylase MiaE [Crocinitomix sp.]|nr:tRNA 2-methylthio-N6-isopentenyl adenosine(37) hydroxylase MiaE [Crocinitomix sp.]
MLGLKLPTDPRWVTIVEGNIDEILTDHAWCEQKAATNAISIITQNPERTELVDALILIVREELEHFELVHERIKKRGNALGPERKDPYVGELYKFMRRGMDRNTSFIDRLLFSAMIEARSCERFRVLSENIPDPELAQFYHELMVSEAGHYTLFLKFARQYSEKVDVDERWNEWLEFEASIITKYGKRETIHG